MDPQVDAVDKGVFAECAIDEETLDLDGGFRRDVLPVDGFGV